MAYQGSMGGVQGTEDMSGTLTTFTAWLQQAGADVSSAWPLIVAAGPVASGAASFLFILLMSYCADLMIWTVLVRFPRVSPSPRSSPSYPPLPLPRQRRRRVLSLRSGA